MEHLQIFQNMADYNHEIGLNGYSEMPSVAKIIGNSYTPYIKKPRYEATYQGPTKLFYTNDNIKRVWKDDELIYEAKFEPQWHEFTVLPTDFTENNGVFERFNQEKIIPIANYPTIEVTVDGGLLPEDRIWMLYNTIYGNAGLTFFVRENYYTEIRPGVLNMNAMFENGPASWLKGVSFLVFRDNTPITTYVTYYGEELRKIKYNEIVLDVVENNAPNIIPGITWEKIKLTPTVEITDVNTYGVAVYYDNVFLGAAQLAHYVYPGMIDMVDGSLIITGPGMVMEDEAAQKVVFCRILNQNVDEYTENDIELIETHVTMYVLESASDVETEPIEITTNDIFTIQYEPFNRFQLPYFKDTNLIRLSDDAIMHIKSDRVFQKHFQNCSMLEKIVLPKSTYDSEDEVFTGCNNLTSITYPEFYRAHDILNQAYFTTTKLSEVICFGDSGPYGNGDFSKITPVKNGVLRVPSGSNYKQMLNWMNSHDGYNWTIEYI